MDEVTGVSSELKAAIEESVAKALEPLRNIKATNNTSGMPMGGESSSTGAPLAGSASSTSAPVTGKDAVDGTGINLARYVKAMAMGKMTGQSAAQVATKQGYTRVAKALQQSTLADGGLLVPPEFSGELIELLRNKTVVRKAGARVVPMNGSLSINRQAGGGTAYYVNELASITDSTQSMDMIQLQEKKLAARTKVSNDLIKNASISAEQFVRDDLIQVLALKEDLSFLRGTGASGEPRGIRHQINSSHVYAETVSSEGSPTLVEIKTELAKAIRKLEEANCPMANVGWVMAPRTKQALLQSADANGVFQLEAEVSNGMLRGFPYYVTNQVPTNLNAGGDESELYLVDFSEVLIGDGQGMEIMVFPNGGDDGIAQDFTWIRAIVKHDLAMRHDKSGVCVTELSWNYA
jgi:HK97 family phage major capsid protein